MANEKRPGRLPSSEAQRLKRLSIPFPYQGENAERRGRLQAIRRISELSAAPGSRALGISRANESRGLWPICSFRGEADDPALAWAVVPAPWLIAIDADSDAAVESLRIWRGAVEAMPGAWCVEVRSGGAGRRHGWAYVPSLHDRGRALGMADTLKLEARSGAGGRMRPIGSPHRSGVGFAEPIGVTLSEVEALLLAARLRECADGVRMTDPAAEAEAEAESRAQDCRLSDDLGRAGAPVWAELEAEREAPKAPLDDSLEVYRWCRDAIEAGRDAAAEYDRIMAEDCGARRWLLKRRNESSRVRFYRQWKAAGRERAQGCPLIGTPSDAVRVAQVGLAAALERSERWRGKSGATDRALWIACCATALEREAVGFEWSYRNMAEAVGVHLETVYAAAQRLIADGFIETVENNRIPEKGLRPTTRWRLCDLSGLSENRKPNKSTPPAVLSLVRIAEWLRADAFDWRALGKNGPLVLAALEAAPGADPDEIAERTGVSRSTVGRILKRAVSVGFSVVERVGERGWKLAQDCAAGLVRLAKALKVEGASGRRRALHVERRKKYLDRQREWMRRVKSYRDPPDLRREALAAAA